VRVLLQFLVPGVENAEKTDIRTQMFRVFGNLDQCLGAGAKQQAIDHFLILQSQRRQFVGKGEDNMGVGHGQEFRTARVEPAVARLALAFWTVPVAARVVGDGTMPATRALIDMAAQRSGPALPDGDKHLEMQPGQPSRTLVNESSSCAANDIGQLKQWPGHSPDLAQRRLGPS